MTVNPTINTEFSVFCKEKLPYVEGYPDLRNELLPFIKIDYLTIHCQQSFSGLNLIHELETLKPDLKIKDLDDVRKTSSESDIVLKKNFFSKTSENKYNEQKYDVILYSHYNEEKGYSKKFARIPGNFSDVLLRSIFDKKTEFPEYDFNLTRFDFKIVIPTLKYTDFEFDLVRFLGYHEVQHLRNMSYCPKKGFALGYVNERTSRRMLRTYFSAKSRSITFELECKRESAKRYSQAVFNKDWYEFNKILILELIEMFKVIKQCSYTQPLLEWNEFYLKILKEREFPTESHYKRDEKKALVNFITNEITMKTLLAQNSYVFNSNLLNFTKPFDKKSSIQLFIYSFCSKMLLEKWNKVIGGPKEIQALIHKSSWDGLLIKNETFTTHDLYEIDFHLKDLLNFLNLGNNTKNRNKVLGFLKEISKHSVEFWVEKDSFSQSFFYLLRVSHTSKGMPMKVKIILHPLIVYDLLNYAVSFQKNFLTQFYKLLEKHRLTEKKKTFTFGHFAFLSVVLAFRKKDPRYLKLFFSTRNKKRPELRKRQLQFLSDLLILATENLEINLGIQSESVVDCPISFCVLENMLNKTTDTLLNHTVFRFHSLKKEEKSD